MYVLDLCLGIDVECLIFNKYVFKSILITVG